ncbi:MAG: 5'-deoxynucleotidase [Clostridia bacterium]|nr:5'-deoxynucleotidase [Clostridia bacterium]
MEQKNSFYALVFRQKYIKRWGLMRNTTPENLSEHANEVAVLTHALCEIGNALFDRSYDCGKAVLLALYHDVPEVYTGDLPTPIKYFDSNSKDSYNAVEECAIRSLLCKIPPQLRPAYEPLFFCPEDLPERRLVKAADKLSAYIKCLEEEKCGNSEFSSAKKTIAASLEGMDLPELRWFIDNLLPTFTLTIDEMQM